MRDGRDQSTADLPLAMSQLSATWVTVRPPDRAPMNCIMLSSGRTCIYMQASSLATTYRQERTAQNKPLLHIKAAQQDMAAWHPMSCASVGDKAGSIGRA